MYTHARRTGLLFAGLLAPLSVHAMDVTVADLPGSIQSCVANATCSVSTTSMYDSATASVFGIYNVGVGQTGYNYLVRYALAAPSGQTISSPSSFTPYTGYVWMQVQGAYSASQTAEPITLYLDKVSAVPASFYGQSGDLSLYVSAADLLAGSSHVNSGLDSNDQSYITGSLSGQVPFGCLAQGCSAFAQLNLAQLQFTQSGTTITTGFNTTDARGLVFAMGAADDGLVSGSPYSITQSFYISAVPEPRPAWLFSSALACLAVVMRRKRNAAN